MTFSRTSKGTEGDLLVMLTEEEPTLARPPLHRHPHEGERFEVRSGTLDHWLGEQAYTAVPGETAVVPPAVPTPGRYPGSEKLVAQVELRPALRFESCLEKPSTARRRREPERRTGPPPGGGPVPRVLRGVRSGSPPCSDAPPPPDEIAPDPRHCVGPFCLGYRPWFSEFNPSGRTVAPPSAWPGRCWPPTRWRRLPPPRTRSGSWGYWSSPCSPPSSRSPPRFVAERAVGGDTQTAIRSICASPESRQTTLSAAATSAGSRRAVRAGEIRHHGHARIRWGTRGWPPGGQSGTRTLLNNRRLC